MIVKDSDGDVMVLMTTEELSEQVKTKFVELSLMLYEYHKNQEG